MNADHETTRGETPAVGSADPPDPAPAVHRGGAWRWWLIGLIGAVGLGTFMWAVDGRWNTNAPQPDGPAATPAEAVEKFLAAVDNHDEGQARRYASERLAPQIDDWIDRAGYVRLLKASDAGGEPATSGSTTLDVTYEGVTGFLNDDAPLGLNLALLVWTEEVSYPFVVTRAADGSGWVVDDGGPPMRK